MYTCHCGYAWSRCRVGPSSHLVGATQKACPIFCSLTSPPTRSVGATWRMGRLLRRMAHLTTHPSQRRQGYSMVAEGFMPQFTLQHRAMVLIMALII